jgi:hypothetical protein
MEPTVSVLAAMDGDMVARRENVGVNVVREYTSSERMMSERRTQISPIERSSGRLKTLPIGLCLEVG